MGQVTDTVSQVAESAKQAIKDAPGPKITGGSDGSADRQAVTRRLFVFLLPRRRRAVCHCEDARTGSSVGDAGHGAAKRIDDADPATAQIITTAIR